MHEFKVKRHTEREGDMVEVWIDGRFMAGIYPHERGIRVISRYLKEVVKEENVPVPAALITLAK